MSINIKMLPIAVQREVELLLIHATKEERSNLNIKEFYPSLPDSCIYGLLTGNCDSDRSKDLMKLCNIDRTWNYSLIPISFNNFITDFTYKYILNKSNCSPIEACVVSKNYSKYNENLINYLRQDL